MCAPTGMKIEHVEEESEPKCGGSEPKMQESEPKWRESEPKCGGSEPFREKRAQMKRKRAQKAGKRAQTEGKRAEITGKRAQTKIFRSHWRRAINNLSPDCAFLLRDTDKAKGGCESEICPNWLRPYREKAR
ncbi:hypothetical protein EV213_10954 [Aureibacillus halotolerans]|uniref:Uncharacterized protein n=1 Tax=Aureibacillus halotolerans TaxID=1508390 RepID=A0A4R6TZA4_9BACI|nr:hypothetical protein EV213_10954 [Aureibacillus halotolerans]